MTDFTIRRATPADLATIVFFNDRIAWETEQKRLNPRIIARGVDAVLRDEHKGFYTLAEDATGILGQVMVTYEFSDWRNGWYWWIQSVYVREDARRRGVFRALYKYLEQTAIADPTVIGLRLYVEHGNTRAKQTYLSLGMSEEPYFVLGVYPLPGRESAFE